MRRLKLVLLGSLGLLSCDLASKVKVPELPKFDWTSVSLPKGKDGKPMLIDVSGSTLGLDLNKRDPISDLADCVDLVTYCVSAERTLDQCVASAQQCDAKKSVTPCCPKTCADDYAQARKRGIDPIPAFDSVYFQQGKCFPDVAKLLGGAP